MSIAIQGAVSVNDYIKTMSMQRSRQNKADTGNFTAKGSTDAAKKDTFSYTSPEDSLKKEEVAPLTEEEEQEQRKRILDSIQNKITAGGKLTGDEMKYLRQNDPIAYNSMKLAEHRKIAHRRALKRCRTKNDVHRLRMAEAGNAISSVSNIKNSPFISDSIKTSMINAANYAFGEKEKNTEEFVRSGEYSRLPTDAELKRERRDKTAKRRRRKTFVVVRTRSPRIGNNDTVPELKAMLWKLNSTEKSSNDDLFQNQNQPNISEEDSITAADKITADTEKTETAQTAENRSRAASCSTVYTAAGKPSGSVSTGTLLNSRG